MASGTIARLRVVVSGPAVQGGVEMTASDVRLGPPAAPGQYTGRLVTLTGSQMQASVAGNGRRLTLIIDLSQAGGRVTGTLAVRGQSGDGQ
jgi:hypothetical protein